MGRAGSGAAQFANPAGPAIVAVAMNFDGDMSASRRPGLWWLCGGTLRGHGGATVCARGNGRQAVVT
jgi:hypothetical protein